MADQWMNNEIWLWLHGSGALFSLVILAAAVVAMFLVDTFFKRVLTRLSKKTETELDDQAVMHFKRPAKLTVALMGVSMAVVPLDLDQELEYWIHAMVQTVLVVVWAVTVLRITRIVLTMMGKKRRTDVVATAALPMLQNLFTVMVVVGCGIWLLDLWHINITPILASAGIATAAVALAAKDTLANFFGGLSIIIDAPYRLGDYVLLGTGERGEVVHIGIRSTRILTRDDVQITVPNAAMANAKIVNQTAPIPRFRVRCQVGVSYNSDPDQVEEVMIQAIRDMDMLLGIPAPRVRFRRFGDSALEFELLAWVKAPADRGLVEHKMNKAVFYAFKKAGIEIPFPQRVVHLASGSEGASIQAESNEASVAGQS